MAKSKIKPEKRESIIFDYYCKNMDLKDLCKKYSEDIDQIYIICKGKTYKNLRDSIIKHSGILENQSKIVQYKKRRTSRFSSKFPEVKNNSLETEKLKKEMCNLMLLL